MSSVAAPLARCPRPTWTPRRQIATSRGLSVSIPAPARYPGVDQIRRWCEHLRGELTESCVVVGMFTGGQLANLSILTESNPSARASMRELVTDRAPHEVLIVAVAPMRTAPAIWHAAEAFTAALAGTTATTTVYTRSLCETAPVIDLAVTNTTTWRG